MNAALLLGLDRAGLVHRLADHVHDPAERLFTDRHGDRLAGVHDLLAPHQTFGDVHRDGADGVFAQVLGDFEDEAIAMVLRLERVQNGWQLVGEMHVDDSARHLRDAADDALALLSGILRHHSTS